MRSIPLIPPEQKSHLEQLLFNLQHYVLAKAESETKGPQSEEDAQMQMLEEYLDKLYDDDVIQKVQGTRAISLLADDPYNIEPLLNNESLLKYIYIYIFIFFFLFFAIFMFYFYCIVLLQEL